VNAEAESDKRPEPIGPDEQGNASRRPSNWRDLGPRSISGLVLVGLALAALWIGGDVFLLFWLLAGLGVAWEWQSLLAAPRRIGRVAISAAAVAFAGEFAISGAADSAVFVLLVGALAVGALAVKRRLWSACGVLYAGAAVAPVCILRASIFDGYEAVLWLLVIVWSSDVMAYFGGRAIGGPKLWPQVSPGKTWSGFVSGTVCSAILALVVLNWLDVPTHVGPAIALGALLSVTAQAGDLFESFVKRRFHVKDSSRIIPGHGGLMDRLDGFIAAASLAASIGVLRYDAASAALGLLRW
jgi:phosphatidate cytidylyltransferase